MLSKFSVRRFFTVLVLIVVVLVLGVVSLRYMKTDLLPNFEVPYLAVITTDPGASPEEVEVKISKVLEGALGSVNGVESVQSVSGDSYSMIYLEFADDTDMDSALVKTSAAVNEVSSQLPESAGTPYYMEINADMIASMYLAVTGKGSMTALSEYADDTATPAIERQEGVANVSATGLVADHIDIVLNQNKIDNVNDGILGETNDKLAETKDKIDDGKAELKRAESKIKAQQKKLKKQQKEATDKLATATEGMNTLLATKSAYSAQLATYQAELAAAKDPMSKAVSQAKVDATQKVIDKLDKQLAKYSSVDAAKSTTLLTLADASSRLADAQSSITANRQKLKEGEEDYKKARDEARKNANINKLVDRKTLAQLIQAQNLEMPAGYVEDGDDSRWLVKMGQEYTSVKELRGMVLTHIDDVGDITLGDVADIKSATSEGSGYAKINGRDGIILSVTKTSTANTGDVSKAVNNEIAELMKDDKDVQILPMMDQGRYINLYITTILQSLALGAALAVIVLAVFLKNVRPTLVVAFSIPFSILLALVFMYFAGFTLNIMTLGALSLSIGMLVDNSIVVMENIYRMRARGLSATRAAAQGAVQVTGAIIASTVTSICVFFPFVFTSGMVRQLMTPFALSISFALLSSLLVALTVVPSISSKIFASRQPSEAKWFAHIQSGYGRVLGWTLRHKAPVLMLAVALLGASIYLVVNMGIVMMPEMTSNQIALTMEMPDEMDKKDAYDIADVIGERVNEVDGVDRVSITDTSAVTGMFAASLASDADTYRGVFSVNATVDTGKVSTEGQVKELRGKLLGIADDLDVELTDSSDMTTTNSLSGDVSVQVTGPEDAKVVKLSEKVVKAMRSIEGYAEVSNGQEKADPTLRLELDRDEIARMGLTVAQLYESLSKDLAETTDAITITRGDNDVDVRIKFDDEKTVSRRNLLDWKFEDGDGDKHKLSKVAKISEEEGVERINREDMIYSTDVTADVEDGYNVTLLARQLQPKLDKIKVPEDYKIKIAGTNEQIDDMLSQMLQLAALGALLVYLVMVAQFQSLLMPFIIILTVPLAFTGGMFALYFAGEQLSMMGIFGFVILMGTVVNNGIVFVDYANQMRESGMAKRPALIATGKTRLRPILATALTTIISMSALIFSQSIGSSMQRGMALVVAGGLLYATVMTLFVVPSIYDILCRKPLMPVDVSGDGIDDAADDAERFMEEMGPQSRETYDYQTRRQRRHARREEKRQAKQAKRDRPKSKTGAHSR